MLGGRTVSTYCKGQAVIALSSGEVEFFNGSVSATSQMLGLQSVLLDWRWMFDPICGWTPQLELLLGAAEGSDE